MIKYFPLVELITNPREADGVTVCKCHTASGSERGNKESKP